MSELLNRDDDAKRLALSQKGGIVLTCPKPFSTFR